MYSRLPAERGPIILLLLPLVPSTAVALPAAGGAKTNTTSDYSVLITASLPSPIPPAIPPANGDRAELIIAQGSSANLLAMMSANQTTTATTSTKSRSESFALGNNSASLGA